MARVDPYRTYRFRVEFDQVQHGGFSRVKGLVRETKTDSYREGGVNDFERKFATLTTFGPLVLEHGLADDYLWKWHEDVVQGKVVRRTVTVSLHDSEDQEAWRWIFDSAFPSKWSGADLDAAASQVAVESVELTHHGFKRG
jgi:phage tail-like protein